MTDTSERNPRKAPNRGSVAHQITTVSDQYLHSGDVAARQARMVDEATTPKIAKGYGPKQKRYREPLVSSRHFGTVAALHQRQEMLSRYSLTSHMAAAQNTWGALYTQALYTDSSKHAQVRALLAQVGLMEWALNEVACKLIKTLEAN